MVEKNVVCPTCRKEKIFFEEFIGPWEDLQRLSWLFCENCSTKTINEIRQKLISC